MSEHRSIRYMAGIIVTTVTHYPQLVTPTMHAGIDLARALNSGDDAITEDAVLTATIRDAFEQLDQATQRYFA